MPKFKTIAWESWNVIEEEQLEDTELNAMQADNIELDEESEEENYPEINPMLLFNANRLVYTPLGNYNIETPLKPSDRWDCWIGHTNFDITGNIAEIIEDTNGVEVFKVMGRYTFFIGVAKLFDIKDVRNEIENTLCHYTEDEILSDIDISETVKLIKNQLDNDEFWAIMIGVDGSVEYVSSNEKSHDYIENVQKLVALKNKIGGIIIHNN